MPIVKGQSDLIPNRATGTGNPDPEKARGRPIVAAGTVTNSATDSAGSKYHLVDLPATAILDALTGFKVDGWGFVTVNIGTETDADALISIARSAGANVVPVVRFGPHHGRPLWQVLGLTAAPASGVISLWVHGPANAIGAGTMPFEIHYRFR